MEYRYKWEFADNKDFIYDNGKIREINIDADLTNIVSCHAVIMSNNKVIADINDPSISKSKNNSYRNFIETLSLTIKQKVTGIDNEELTAEEQEKLDKIKNNNGNAALSKAYFVDNGIIKSFTGKDVTLNGSYLEFNKKDENKSSANDINTENNEENNRDCFGIIESAIESSAKKCVIFTGAPGTGKTYCVEKYVEDKMPGFDRSEYFVQFHSSYDYTDFVEGLRPVDAGNGNMKFVRMDGIFKAFCRKVAENNKLAEPQEKTDENTDAKELPKYYFVIDEINRADLGRVFGELMYCFEKRGEEHKITTQYANLLTCDEKGDPIKVDCFKDGFYIPENVVIIGTMNDIDRSVETFDFALRRRFDWVEIEADTVMESSLTSMLDNRIKDETITEEQIHELTGKIAAMNSEIAKHIGLSKEFKIGPAYFKGYDGENLEDIWKHNIEPILREYVRGRQSAENDNFIDNCHKALMNDVKQNDTNTGNQNSDVPGDE